MIQNDMVIFMALFAMFFLNYGLAMYITYPRTGQMSFDLAPHFNNLQGASLELFELAFQGDPIKIFLDVPLDQLTTAQTLELAIFGLFYVLYCLFALVVLLNLLIAMLGFTFSGVQMDAVLEWRVLYARNIIKMETQASFFAAPPFEWWMLHGGEKVGDRYYVFSRSYDEVDEVGEPVKMESVPIRPPPTTKQEDAASRIQHTFLRRSSAQRLKSAADGDDDDEGPQRRTSLLSQLGSQSTQSFKLGEARTVKGLLQWGSTKLAIGKTRATVCSFCPQHDSPCRTDDERRSSARLPPPHALRPLEA